MQKCAHAAQVIDDKFLATVRIERFCARRENTANAQEKPHSAYTCGALCKTQQN